jgi:hypothetical protein
VDRERNDGGIQNVINFTHEWYLQFDKAALIVIWGYGNSWECHQW